MEDRAILHRSTRPVVGLLVGLVAVLLVRVGVVQLGDEHRADPRNAFVRGWIDTERSLPTVTAVDGTVIVRSVVEGERFVRRYFAPDLVPLVGVVPAHGVPVGVEQWVARLDDDADDVRLAIDPQVQAAAADAVAGGPGAVLVLGIDGTVVAAADTTTETREPVDVLARGGDAAGSGEVWPPGRGTVLFDRPVAAGSSLKPLLFAMALDAGVVRPGQELPAARGYQPAGGRWVANNADSECPPADVVRSLALSCNSTALRLADLLGSGAVGDALRAFGFGAAPPGVRSSAASMAALADGWPLSVDETSLAAIGQGEARVTLLGLGLAYAALAGGDGVPLPRFLADDPDGRWLPAPVSAEACDVVLEGMRSAVEEGTAIGLAGWDVLAKTGTATRADGHGSDGWMVTLVPATDPRHVVVTYVSGDEDDVSGADGAEPTATVLAALGAPGSDR